VKRLSSLFKRLKVFLRAGIWDVPLESLNGLKKAGVKFLKVILFSMRKLKQDQLLLRAPALAFFSLLAVVPLAALVFGVAKGFGLQEVLEKQIQEQMALPGDVQTMILEFARTTLQKAKGGWVAGLGLVFLFVSVTLVLSGAEASFNKIWGIRRGRSLSVKVRDYFSMIFIGTILLLVSLGLTVALANAPSVFGYLDRAVSFFLSLVPYVIAWLMFAFLIVFMPNRKVGLKTGLVAGVIAGTLYQLLLHFYIRLQVTVSVYNAIYGSFAALPLFLLWLQVSWICLLVGAEISYSFENVGTMGLERDPYKISTGTRRMILLQIMHDIVKHFEDPAKPPPTSDRIARELGVSGQLVNHFLEDLVEKGLISETLDKQNGQTGYQPGVPPRTLTVHRILRTVEEEGAVSVPVKEKPSLHKIKKILNEMDQAFERSSANVKIDSLD
jgi:membrane protein